MRYAILLGNGINNYAHRRQGANKNSSSVSWEEIVTNIANKSIYKKNRLPNSLLNGLTLIELFELITLSSNGKDENQARDDFLNQIKFSTTEIHTSLVDFAKKNQIPILTTNFDTTLCDKGPHKFPGPFTHFYPWHSYYASQEITDPLLEHAIWHIHGMKKYKNSMKLKLSDYVNFLSRIKEYLNGKKHPGGKVSLYSVINDSKNNSIDPEMERWVGARSWLDVFLHLPLVIIGLGLNFREFGLRWLLIQRYKYHLYCQKIKIKIPRAKSLPKLPFTDVYIETNLENSMATMEETGKKLFFETLNFRYYRRKPAEIYEGNWEWIHDLIGGK